MASVRLMLLMPLFVLAVNLALPVNLTKIITNWEALLEVLHQDRHEDGDYSKLIDDLIKDPEFPLGPEKDKLALLQQAIQMDKQLCNIEKMNWLSESAEPHSEYFRNYVQSQIDKLVGVCLGEKHDDVTALLNSRVDTIRFIESLEWPPVNSEADKLVNSLQTVRVNSKLCQDENYKSLWRLARSYGKHSKKYVKDQQSKLVSVCLSGASDVLRYLLDKRDYVYKLKEMILLANSVYRGLTVNYLINEHHFTQEMIVAGIVRYMRSKGVEQVKREEFHTLFGKYVLDTCKKWTAATDYVDEWAKYYKYYEYEKTVTLTRQQIDWINYRVICETIVSTADNLKCLVYDKLKEEYSWPNKIKKLAGCVKGKREWE